MLTLPRPRTPATPDSHATPRVIPGGRHAAIRAERAEKARRRSISVASAALQRSDIPSRRHNSAVGCFPQTALTRLIYHHAREHLARHVPAHPVRHKKRRENPGWRVLVAVRHAAKRVILETTVIRILQDAVEDRRQLKAKEAEDLWRKLLLEFPFFFELEAIREDTEEDVENKASAARRVAEALEDLLAEFRGAGAVKERFLTVASSFRASASALRKLTASFGENLEGLQEMHSTIERCAEEALRLIRLFEGRVGDMRTELRNTLRSRSTDVSSDELIDAAPDVLLQHGAELATPTQDDAPDEVATDCVSSLLESLERDLCDKPVKMLHEATEDIASKISQSTGAMPVLPQGVEAQNGGATPPLLPLRVEALHQDGNRAREEATDKGHGAVGCSPLALLRDMMEVLKPSKNTLLQLRAAEGEAASFVMQSAHAAPMQCNSLSLVNQTQSTHRSHADSLGGIKVKAKLPLSQGMQLSELLQPDDEAPPDAAAGAEDASANAAGAEQSLGESRAAASAAPVARGGSSARNFTQVSNMAIDVKSKGSHPHIDDPAATLVDCSSVQLKPAGAHQQLPASSTEGPDQLQANMSHAQKWWSIAPASKNASANSETGVAANSEDAESAVLGELLAAAGITQKRLRAKHASCAQGLDGQDQSSGEVSLAGHLPEQRVQDEPSGLVRLSAECGGTLPLGSMAANTSSSDASGTRCGDSLEGPHARTFSVVDSTQDRKVRDGLSADPAEGDIEHHSGNQRHLADGDAAEFQLRPPPGTSNSATLAEPESCISPEQWSCGMEPTSFSSSDSVNVTSPVAAELSHQRQRDRHLAGKDASPQLSRQSRERRKMTKSPLSHARSFDAMTGNDNLAQASHAHHKLMGMQSFSRKAGFEAAAWAPLAASQGSALAEVEEGPLQSPPPQESPQDPLPLLQAPRPGGNSPSSTELLLVSRSMVLGNRRGSRGQSPPPPKAEGSAVGKSPRAAGSRSLTWSASEPQLVPTAMRSAPTPLQRAPPQESPPVQRRPSAGGTSPSSSGPSLVSRSMVLGNRRGSRGQSPPPPKVAEVSGALKSPLAAAGRSLALSASEPQLVPTAMGSPPRRESQPVQQTSCTGRISPSSSGPSLVSRSMVLGNRRGSRGQSPPPSKVADGSSFGKCPLGAAGRSLASSASDPQLAPGAMPKGEKVFKDRKFAPGNRSMVMVPPVTASRIAYTPGENLSMNPQQQSCRPFDIRGTRRDQSLGGLPAIDFQQYPIKAFPAQKWLHGMRT